ncbi:SET domain-containing protein [Piedraia hortae CBS 480.64]|uniref:SET domain-containing protein n=1 Tax=Piedraia hortae CBS 480.64 TaxID=1314780 RepID=A0A6A7C699_9PEZI|nr:SET domain-containing protein [Piedraia hortae CBS 480.64]
MTSNTNCTVLQRSSNIHLVSDTPKGRAIYANEPIPSGTIIDTCPVLVLPSSEEEFIRKTQLWHYTYHWPGSDPATICQAVVFGLGSLFNHSRRNQNVGWMRNLEKQTITYTALRDIEKGEELCVSYGDDLTFEDVEKDEDDGENEGGGLMDIEIGNS